MLQFDKSKDKLYYIIVMRLYGMKKLLLLLLFIIATFSTFCSRVFAEDIFKITSANFDTSNSIMVISAQDNTFEQIMPDVKIVTLENPKRAYFDINSAILTIPKQDWSFNSPGIKQVKISQFTTNPDVVRVVMYLDEDFSASDIKFMKIKNNIILKFKSPMCQNPYFQHTYRDEHASSSDFYEYMSIYTPVKKEITENNIVEQLQEAFNTTVQQVTAPEVEKMQLRLNTKYYIDRITTKPNAVLINGFGSLTVEKPMILTNPTRIVFDMSNTLVAQNLRNKDFKINETESVKIGQFSVNKARIVITTPDVEKYIPIYSNDNQSLLIANMNSVIPSTLYSTSADMLTYNLEELDNQTDAMTLSFSHPVVHGFDRTNNEIILYLYNVSKYNEQMFKNTYAKSLFSKAEISLMSGNGLKLTIPIDKDSLVNTYLGADGKALKISVKAPKKAIAPVTPVIKKPTGVKRIVIDAGHGGTDYGAIRNGINEKDITLDVSKRVEALLKKQGYQVTMTRTNDIYVSLADRVAISEKVAPDIFVSIHVNSSTRPEITGIETHYYHQESLNLAQTVHSSFASAIKSNNRGLFKSKFYVINHTTSPAILIEIGFISNDNERAQLVSDKRKQDTAKSIVEGINNYFKQH